MQRKCPGCGHFNTRRSAVRAYELTARHIFLSPYRCRDCDTRFWVTSRHVYSLAGIIGVALVTGGVAWNVRTLLDSTRTQPERTTQDGGQFEERIKLAEKGDPDAERDVATLYAHGYGVAKSEAEARRWLERAAEHGNLSAEYELGIALRDGRGALQDYEGATKWIQRAAEGGHAQAQYALGMMYRAGIGVPASNVKAYTWLNLAAARGVADAAVVRDSVLGHLSPLETIEAQGEARRLSAVLPPPPAAVK